MFILCTCNVHTCTCNYVLLDFFSIKYKIILIHAQCIVVICMVFTCMSGYIMYNILTSGYIMYNY